MNIYLVGGFLGSGKTTAIAKACALLAAEGKNVAVITNDQGSQLVDSQFIRSLHIPVCEVINGCFCCNYNQLRDHLDALARDTQPAIIFAESVGSCTDLVATVVNPLLKYYPETKVVVSILVDAALLYEMVASGDSVFTAEVQYIFERQLEEADLLIINKTDLLDEDALRVLKKYLEEKFPGKELLFQSLLNLSSSQNWLQSLGQFTPTGIRRSLDISYDTYGKGEAMLAWLDESIAMDSDEDNAPALADELMHNIHKKIRAENLAIGHLKFLLHDGVSSNKISFTQYGKQPIILKAAPIRSSRATLLVNARVQTQPARLAAIVDDALRDVQAKGTCRIQVNAASAFSPGFPVPTYRLIS